MDEFNDKDLSKLHKPPEATEKGNKKECLRGGGKFFDLTPTMKAHEYVSWEDRKKELQEIEKRLSKEMENSNLSVGDSTWVSPSVIFDTSAKITIGNNCLITHRTVIYTHSHPGYLKREFDDLDLQQIETSPLVIEDDVCIFSDCIIMPSVERIHKSCIIMTGSVLTKSTTAPYQIWGGNPAKLIKYKDE